ncbi:hypothetical protein ACA910_012141 [Epithemia clementina (nom. ined.)]
MGVCSGRCISIALLLISILLHVNDAAAAAFVGEASQRYSVRSDLASSTTAAGDSSHHHRRRVTNTASTSRQDKADHVAAAMAKGVKIARSDILIRSTIASDLPMVAKMLSTAASNNKYHKNNNNNNSWGGLAGMWRARIDQQFAQADIESLLRGRLEALVEGRKAYQKLAPHLVPVTDPHDRVKALWWNSDRLRYRIERASTETGEDNVWRHHNFALTPLDPSWFHHLQMTAQDIATGQVVGFCEVALLSNPLTESKGNNNNNNNNNNHNHNAIPNAPSGTSWTSSSSSSTNGFAPAILNLATAPEWRRMGIATRLLGLAERFAQRQWKSSQLGLYVDKANPAALALYQGRGYYQQAKVTSDNRGEDDRLGDLWYMTKPLLLLSSSSSSSLSTTVVPPTTVEVNGTVSSTRIATTTTTSKKRQEQ